MVALAAVAVLATGLILWVLPGSAPHLLTALAVHLVVGTVGFFALAIYLPRHLAATARNRGALPRSSGWLLLTGSGLLLATGLFACLPRDRLGAGMHDSVVLAHGILGTIAVVGAWAHRYTAPRDVLPVGEVIGLFALLGGVVVIAALASHPASPPPSAPIRPLSSLQIAATHPIPVPVLAETDRCAACHADIVAQWSKSAHRYASFANPFYLHALRTLDAARGRDATRFCAGCHDPLPLLTGAFDGTAPFAETAPFADRGITCLVCHTTWHADDPRGNGGLAFGAASGLHPGSSSPAPESSITARLTRIDPRAHRSRLSSPILRTAAFCGSCHKVGLLPEVTGWRFVRGFNDADPWQQSSSSHEVALAFGSAEEKGCADCHMRRLPSRDLAARGGTVLDHRFAAANLALPSHFHDEEWSARTREGLAEARAVAVPIGLQRGDALSVGLGGPVAAPAGEEVTLHVLVTAPGVGHLFPGGTLDSNETWVELEAKDDATGEVIARSGLPAEDGGPPSGAHVLRARPLDARGEAILERDAFRTRTVLYNHAAVAGAGELVRYRFRMPPKDGGTVSITTRLWFRKFSRAFFGAVYRARGQKAPSEERVLLSEKRARLRVGAPSDAGACDPELTPLLLRYAPSATMQGDTHTAIQVARAAAACGAKGPAAVLEARASLRANQPARALELVSAIAAGSTPAPPPLMDAARMVRALASQALGDDATALSVLGELAARFPRDREVEKTRARVLLRSGDARGAIEAAEHALAVDPEDASACYVEMLAAAEAGAPEIEARARRCYEKYREDETQRPLRRLRRDADPDDDLEAEAVHVHDATPHAPAAK